MAEAEGFVALPPERVWDTLADGWLYPLWVVGTSTIRSVEPGWPAVGTRLHHSTGLWPVQVQDESEVLESEPGSLLVLQARGWPAGEARITIRLAASGDGTEVRIAEQPTSGPGAWVHSWVTEQVLRRRLQEMLSRLRTVVEGRS